MNTLSAECACSVTFDRDIHIYFDASLTVGLHILRFICNNKNCVLCVMFGDNNRPFYINGKVEFKKF